MWEYGVDKRLYATKCTPTTLTPNCRLHTSLGQLCRPPTSYELKDWAGRGHKTYRPAYRTQNFILAYLKNLLAKTTTYLYVYTTHVYVANDSNIKLIYSYMLLFMQCIYNTLIPSDGNRATCSSVAYTRETIDQVWQYREIVEVYVYV